MDKVYKVYRIDHKIDGELQAVYIGYTSKSLRCRLNQHLHDKTCTFGRYWLAYTNNNHRTHLDELTIAELDSTDIKADAIKIEEEQTRITKKIYGDKCLNDSIGNRHSEESKKKMAEANRGKKRSEEFKSRISKTLKGKFKGSNNPRSRSCVYDSKTFSCIKEAYQYAQEHGYAKSYNAFCNMIKKRI